MVKTSTLGLLITIVGVFLYAVLGQAYLAIAVLLIGVGYMAARLTIFKPMAPPGDPSYEQKAQAQTQQ